MYQSAVKLKRGDSVLWVRKYRDGDTEVPAKVVDQTEKRVAIEFDVGFGRMLRHVEHKDLKLMGPRRQQ